MLSQLLFIVFSLSNQAEAQIANASVFPEMKSVNPAVIGTRKVGQYLVSGSQTNVTKNTKLEQTKGSPIEGKIDSKIKLDNYNFFRGGKGGGFITSEIGYDNVQGDKSDTIIYSDSPLEVTSKASNSYANIALAFGKYLGFSYTNIKYKYDINFRQTFGGITLDSRSITELDVNTFRPGIRTDFLGLQFGAYYDLIQFKGKQESTFQATGQTTSSNSSTDFPDSKIIGFGLGKATPRFNFELSYETMPWEKQPKGSTETLETAQRLAGLLEFKVGAKLILGAKYSIYKNQFTDLDRIINSQMLYGNMNGSSRAETLINFAWGNDKGFALGGSFSYANFESKEKPSIINTTQKQDVTTKSVGYGLKLGYSF
jgi:hypothetical protein